MLHAGCTMVLPALLTSGLAERAAAATAWQWTDKHGQVHFGDSPPASAAGVPIELPAGEPGNGTGLRPEERDRLQAIDRQLAKQRRAAEQSRRRHRAQRAHEEDTCREKREQQRRGRRHVDGKQISRYLRTHCW